MQEYEQLMDLKVELDQEIATYRALLQEEENRCVCVCFMFVSINAPHLYTLTDST